MLREVRDHYRKLSRVDRKHLSVLNYYMRFFCRCILSGAAFLTQLTGTGAPIRYSWSGVVTSATSFLDPTIPLPALGTRYNGVFTYDPDASMDQTLKIGCYLSWKRYYIYDDTTQWSNSKQDVFVYEEGEDSCGWGLLQQGLFLRSNDSSLFTLGTPLPAKLPPLKAFDIHEFSYSRNQSFFFTVTLDTLSGPDDSGIETKISSIRNVGTNLVINFTAPSSSTIYLQQRLLSTNWTDAMQIGGWKGVFTLPLPTNGLGLYRLKKTI
jgi:hypothetical protein